jgi:DNA-binding SARP family transcriptional activator/ABC-type branched-subunit amino acid transport system substrate-binding protein/DNA-binding beta-propeller fold protein YncE
VLAILLLHPGEAVSADRLIDLLWGDAPPEDAATALQQHVSRLRRALEPHTVIVTRAPGYAAEPPDGALDLARFEALRAAGAAALAAGRPEDAAARLGDALTEWRGRPLADLEDQPFAREALPRLEEARLEALELRVEADLAAGRDHDLVAELRALAAAHPLRGRFRAQLMLALYRAGRQAEALEVYADARRTFTGELGLEPDATLRRLQQAILEQDPALDLAPPAAAPAPQPPPPRPRGRWLPALAAAALTAGVVAVVALGAGDGEPGSPSRSAAAKTPAGSGLVAVDARTGRVTAHRRAGRTPAALAAAPDGRLWVVDGDARTVVALGASGSAEVLATGGTPIDVAAGPGGVWVVNGRPGAGAQFVGPLPRELIAFDPATRTARATVPLPRADGPVNNTSGARIAAGAGAVWVLTADGAVARVEPATSAITARSRPLDAVAVAAGGAGVWVLRGDGRVVALDPRTARIRMRARLPTSAPAALAVGPTAAWATSAVEGTLWRIGRDGAVGAVAVGAGAAAVAAGAEGVWVANAISGALTAVDPATMRVVRTVRVTGVPRALALAGGTVWVAVTGDAAPAAERVAGVTPVAGPTCGPVVAGAGGRADVLLVSDLPLQGGIRITARQMEQAITFVLREHGFRAGRFRVALQLCDDSLARTGLFDEATCAANARRYAAAADVLAVLGPLNSFCAVAAVPELNRARGGPLAMVSPLTSFVGLTRHGPGIDPELLAHLYPTGRRSFLRVFPTDDLQGAALAELARDRGRSRAFVLDDGQPGYGQLMAAGFARAARRLGLAVADRATWDPGARSYAALARRVAASGADAVFIGGLLDSNAAAVIRAVRAQTDADVLGPDGLTPLSLLARKAGPGARGAFVSLPGVITERLPAAGAAWARRFARTQPGAEVEPSAVYAAQAAEVALAAIARSDGTRASVLDALFATRVRGGLLGDFGFDAAGDISESPVTVVRVARGGGSRRIHSIEGGVVERVARPSASLVE